MILPISDYTTEAEFSEDSLKWIIKVTNIKTGQSVDMFADGALFTDGENLIRDPEDPQIMRLKEIALDTLCAQELSDFT